MPRWELWGTASLRHSPAAARACHHRGNESATPAISRDSQHPSIPGRLPCPTLGLLSSLAALPSRSPLRPFLLELDLVVVQEFLVSSTVPWRSLFVPLLLQRLHLWWSRSFSYPSIVLGRSKFVSLGNQESKDRSFFQFDIVGPLSSSFENMASTLNDGIQNMGVSDTFVNTKAQPSAADTIQHTKEAAKEHRGSEHSMLAPFTAGWQMKAGVPLVIERGEGVYVWDNKGNKYIDALAGLWCTALGFSEKRLVAAAEKQLSTLPFYHNFWNRTTQPALDLAEQLVDLFTASKMSKVFFCNSGSEANDTQVKLVWYYNNALGRPSKKKFIARQKSYHGSTLISASLTGLPSLQNGFDLPVSFVLHTDCPHYWRYHLPGESEENFATRLAENLEKLILKEGPETIAAFIGEPVMGAGGVMPPPKTYWDKVQPILKKYDILLIADEVVCAFGRLGTMFGCDYYGIKPDLVTIAKALSSAYQPIGAVFVSQEIFDAIAKFSDGFGAFGHGFTYSGHPVPCAVSLEALKIYKEMDICAKVNKLIPPFQAGMRQLAKSSVVGEVRGVGLVCAIEFAADKETCEAFPAKWAVGTHFGGQCASRGMLVRVAGDIIMMSPPLITSPEEIDFMVKTAMAGVVETEKYVAEKLSHKEAS